MNTKHTSGPVNTDRYHGMNETQLQSEIYKLDTALRNVVASLKKWDGANDSENYAHKFVWEAYDTARAAIAKAEGA